MIDPKIYPLLAEKFSDLKVKSFEKNLIYILRQFNIEFKNNSELSEKFQQEILKLIQSKDWDWFATDIDNNIILTYPLYNNIEKVVDYLLNYSKYDLSKYNVLLENALTATVHLNGEKNINKILSVKDIHEEYVAALWAKCYIFHSKGFDKHNNNYYYDLKENIRNYSLNYSLAFKKLNQWLDQDQASINIINDFFSQNFDGKYIILKEWFNNLESGFSGHLLNATHPNYISNYFSGTRRLKENFLYELLQKYIIYEEFDNKFNREKDNNLKNNNLKLKI